MTGGDFAFAWGLGAGWCYVVTQHGWNAGAITLAVVSLGLFLFCEIR